MIHLTHNDLTITQHPVMVSHLPAGFLARQGRYRIVQISDLHIYEYTDPAYYQRVTDHVAELDPDVVVATGDFVHYGDRYLSLAKEILSRVKGRDGQFAVIGNHDYEDGHHSHAVRKMLKEAGFELLLNQSVCLEKPGGDKLWLAGLDDYKYGKPDMALAMRDVPPESSEGCSPVVMLGHNPRLFDRVAAYEKTPVSLCLSGHTHGGHVFLPPLLPIYRYVLHMKYRYGFYEKNRSRLYVTSGLGGAAFYIHTPFFQSGFPRFRYNTLPEIAVMDLMPNLPQVKESDLPEKILAVT